MDIVYLVKNCTENEELTYSLRGLANLPHDKVFIVGGFPKNLNSSNLLHIPALQTQTKYKNTTTSLKLICRNKELSDDFILMNDDFFVLEPINDVVKELNLCRGSISEVLNDYFIRYKQQENPYISGMKQTKIFLEDIGFKNPISYELHIPMVMNKYKFLKMFEIPHIDSVRVLHKRSLYGNLYMKDSKKINDVKVVRNYYYPLGSTKFISTEDDTFRQVKCFLDTLPVFRNKSKYEK